MLTLESPAFENGAHIPTRYTCDDADVSPPLRWSGVPAGTESLALIVEDPDAPDPAAPKRIWLHWLVYNIPPALTALPDSASVAHLQPPVREGMNDGGRLGYSGACPPKGRHRYFHRLYALDTMLPDLGARARKGDLERAMAGHVLAQAELVGTYAKHR